MLYIFFKSRKVISLIPLLLVYEEKAHFVTSKEMEDYFIICFSQVLLSETTVIKKDGLTFFKIGERQRK